MEAIFSCIQRLWGAAALCMAGTATSVHEKGNGHQIIVDLEGNMDTSDRLLRRLWLMERMEMILRESIYHRAHHEVEQTPALIVWRKDEATGAVKIPAMEINRGSEIRTFP